jgi:hypothetical protein
LPVPFSSGYTPNPGIWSLAEERDPRGEIARRAYKADAEANVFRRGRHDPHGPAAFG